MDLNKMVNGALQDIQASGFVEQMVHKRLEETLKG